MGNNILKGFIVNRRLMLLVTGLGLSVISVQAQIEQSSQNSITEIVDKSDGNSETEIKIVQALTEELEKRIADVKTEADLKELIKETKQLACQLNEAHVVFDGELFKLAALGAVEGLALPVGYALTEWIRTKQFDYTNALEMPFAAGIISSALSKALAGKVGTLPKAKLNDFLTSQELIKSLLAGVAQVGLYYGLNMLVDKTIWVDSSSPKWAQCGVIGLMFVVIPAVSTAVPSSITTLLKRIEKRNAAKHVIANRDNS